MRQTKAASGAGDDSGAVATLEIWVVAPEDLATGFWDTPGAGNVGAEESTVGTADGAFIWKGTGGKVLGCNAAELLATCAGFSAEKPVKFTPAPITGSGSDGSEPCAANGIAGFSGIGASNRSKDKMGETPRAKSTGASVAPATSADRARLRCTAVDVCCGQRLALAEGARREPRARYGNFGREGYRCGSADRRRGQGAETSFSAVNTAMAVIERWFSVCETAHKFCGYEEVTDHSRESFKNVCIDRKVFVRGIGSRFNS